ncbi:MAG: ComEC/Rec2 family competence protein [Prochlorothrix sp.]
MALLLLAYPVGLILAGRPGFESWGAGGSLGLVLGSAIGAGVLPRLWPTGPRPPLWILMGLVAWLAVGMFQVRLPQPGPQDISQMLGPSPGGSLGVEVTGTVIDSPRLTRSQRVRFLLRCQQVKPLEQLNGQSSDRSATSHPQAQVSAPSPVLVTTRMPAQTTSPANLQANLQANGQGIASAGLWLNSPVHAPAHLQTSSQARSSAGFPTNVPANLQANEANSPAPVAVASPVNGSLYVTVPLLQGTGIKPGQSLTLAGNLYTPRSPTNPGGFDFRAYLLRRGTFAGLTAWRVIDRVAAPRWRTLGWSLRQRIVQAHAWGLPSPAAPLISAMALGRKAVDLPFETQDAFARIGLAHTIAASGFHVSLVLGVVLALARGASPRGQFGLGFTVLLLFLGLTGAQPSILRAVIMGSVALAGLAWDKSVKPLGLLLLSAIGLLLIQPLWIRDLGFQLSFLATLGLLVTAQPLADRLDRLPPVIASAIAVPLAATLWTLPLQLFHFGLFSPYTLVVNLVTLPWVYLLSLGGILSAAVAVLWPPGGTGLALLLHYPAQSLLSLVTGFNQLPGATIAVGTLAGLQVVLLYGLMLGWWFGRPKARMAGAIGVLMLGLALGPGWWQRLHWEQVTFLRGDRVPLAVVQHQGQVGVINSGSGDRVHYHLLPFLRQQGVNRLDWAVRTVRSQDTDRAWNQLLTEVPVTQFVDAVPVAQGGLTAEQGGTGEQSPAEENGAEAGVDRPVPDQEASQWFQTVLLKTLKRQGGEYRALTTDSLELSPLTLVPLFPYQTAPQQIGAQQIGAPRRSSQTHQTHQMNQPSQLSQPSQSPGVAASQDVTPDGGAWFWTWSGQFDGILVDLSIADQVDLAAHLTSPEFTASWPSRQPWLWWTGGALSPDLLAALDWQGAIVTGGRATAETIAALRAHRIPVYGGAQQSALRWSPDRGLVVMNLDLPI